MAFKMTPLAAVLVLALGAAAKGREEPVPAPDPEAATAPAYPTPPETPDPYTASSNEVPKSWGWGPCGSPWELSFSAALMLLLVPIMLAFFISGLRKHRHAWKPLVLGLFALGLGALATVWGLHDSFALTANEWGTCGFPDLCAAVARNLRNLIAGLIIALAGGVLTVILRWRNAGWQDLNAELADEVEPEAEG